jgi:integrase
MKVTIENLEGRLRLRWTCPETGKRKNLALGVDNSTTGRAYAQTIKAQIENDAKFGYYDPTLIKYKPRTIGKNPSDINAFELFDRFTQYQFKHEGLARSSVKSRYEPVKRMLEKHLNIPAQTVDKGRAISFANICENTLTPGTAKARIMLLKSAWDWGKDRYQLSDENPWVGLAKRFRSVDVRSPAAFTQAEVKLIIQG